MKKIKITLSNNDILDVPCSVLFMKHIEGNVCMPEEAINKRLNHGGNDIFRQHEASDAVDLFTYNTLPYPYIHVINFHRDDLPFTYASVNTYGRGMIRFALEKSTADKPITTIATAIHGPGAGLDASEAMEKMVLAFADELCTENPHPLPLEEIIFVEKNASVFERLRERVAFLVRSNVLVYEQSKTYLVIDEKKGRSLMAAQSDVTLRKSHVFVAMPFDRNFDDVYLYGIKQAIEKNGRVSERTDQEFFTGDIIQRIKLRIMESELIVADISGNNPNVFYEIGLADGMNLVTVARANRDETDAVKKQIIFISQEDKVPFDIQTQNRIQYDRLVIKDLEEKLAAAISDILHQPRDE